MGTLVARTLPAFMNKSPVDHTYVECGTGAKAWGCWGRKSGGKFLIAGTASTLQADKIAQPDEHANITCYLINGVCHQAANRILVHAGVIVSGARGYQISEALFGTYGRVRGLPFGLCKGPFEQYPGVTGDLPECSDSKPQSADVQRFMGQGVQPSASERTHISNVKKLYDDYGYFSGKFLQAGEGDFIDFHVTLFTEQVHSRLQDMASQKLVESLRGIRRDTELERGPIEQALQAGKLDIVGFAKQFDDLAVRFQQRCGEMLKDQEYERLFDLERKDLVRLSDPFAVQQMAERGGGEPEPGATP